MKITPNSFTELLPLQILYIFVSPLSAVGHNTSILVVGSFHHTSRSIHLTSFTISNRLYWIHLELVYCQVAHISIWSVGSALYQLADSIVDHRLRFFFVVGRQEMVKQKYKNVQRKTNKWNRKFKINTFFFLEHVTSDSLNCYLYKFFTFLFHHCQLLVITHPSW